MHPQPGHNNEHADELIETVVIGGGQAGLAAGYHLAAQQRNFIILDEQQHTGDSWRMRWDSLRLFTPSQVNGLPGFPFPKPDNYFPLKDEVADYLEQYAGRFHLPVRHGVKVAGLRRDGSRYLVSADTSTFVAGSVVVATGPYQVARLPGFAAGLDDRIGQLHSSAYRSPSQITAQKVLIVGAANSGVEIALELAQGGKEVWLAGRDVGHLPIAGRTGGVLGGRVTWWLMSRLLTVNTPLGRTARIRYLQRGHPLGRARRDDLIRAGVQLVGPVSGIHTGKPQLEQDHLLSVEYVIWATGYRRDYRWIDLPIFDQDGEPRQKRGVVADAPGIYFVGLPFQTAINSSLLGGVGSDAAYVARQLLHSNVHA